MNLKKFFPTVAIVLTLSACGSNFEWFPKVDDTTAPAISATVSGKPLFDNRTTHLSSLPATVTFSANEPATIYYTTNGSDPTKSSASVDIPSTNSSATGPSIITDTILKFFGIDKSTKQNQSATITTHIKSP